MIPITIVDNFFETPSLIRDYALSLDYSQERSNFPGIRTQRLDIINPDLNDLLARKLFSLFFNLDNDRIGWEISSGFQLTDKTFDSGWAHLDGTMAQFAGVIYLNPNAPLNGGTTICKLKHEMRDEFNKNIDEHNDLKDKFYKGETVDLEYYKSKKDLHNSYFDTTLEVSNVFNRLFLYDGSYYHRENMFFGEGKESRLTLVFFGKLVTYDQTRTPITRSKTIFTY